MILLAFIILIDAYGIGPNRLLQSFTEKSLQGFSQIRSNLGSVPGAKKVFRAGWSSLVYERTTKRDTGSAINLKTSKKSSSGKISWSAA